MPEDGHVFKVLEYITALAVDLLQDGNRLEEQCIMDSLGLTASLLVIFTLSSDHLEVYLYRLQHPFTFRTVQRSLLRYDFAVGSF